MLRIDINDKRVVRYFIIGGFSLMLAIIILYGMFLRPRSANRDLRRNILNREKDLKQIHRLRKEFLRLQESKEFFKKRTNNKAKEFELSSFMESKMDSLDIEQYQEHMKRFDEKLDNNFQLASINISFKDIPLKEFIRYIYECETNQHPLWIDKLSLAPVEDSNNLMDVNMSVTTFNIQN